MTVPVQNPYNSYNANGATTQFRYEFLIKDASDLSVTLNGAVVDKSLYTLTNIGQSNGGDVKFTTAPAVGLLIIRRAVIAQRLTDYQDNGPLRAEDVNRDFDRVVMMIQDKQADADTALKHPLGQNGTSAPYTYDANGGRIIDLGTPTADTDAATKKYVDDLYVDKAAQAVRQAEAARDAAAVSANAAASSQQSASSSQSAASGSQTAAKTSETNAANSASAAAASASAAAGSASTATQAAGTASGAATTATQASSGATQQANQASASATAAGQSATAAAGSATTAGQQAGAAAGSATAAFNAQKAAEKARDEAINVAPGNYMLKTNNLSDLTDKSLARSALNVQGVKCVSSIAAGDFNALSSPDDKLNLLIANNGVWGAQSTTGEVKPLLVERGGTGATTASAARANLGLENFIKSGIEARVTDPSNQQRYIYINSDPTNPWGVYDLTAGGPIPLSVRGGGTGSVDAAGARTSLKVTFQDDQPIADSESINNDRFFKPGFYYKQYDPAATIENGFPPGNRSGALHTILNGANGAKGVTQLYYPYIGAGGAYFRQYDAMRNTFLDGTSFNGWKELSSNNGHVVAGVSEPITVANRINDVNDAKMNHVGFSYNSATNSPGKSGTFVGFENAIVKGYGFQFVGSYDAPGNLYYRSRNGDSQTWYPWVKMYGTNNTTTDTNGNLKPSSPIVKLKGDGTAELNEEAKGVMVKRIDTGVYKVSGVLGFNSDPIWGGINGGYVIPQNGNGLPLLWVDYDVEPNGDLTVRTYHREHINVPAYARNHIDGLADGDPVDIPAGRWVDLRVDMPDDGKQ